MKRFALLKSIMEHYFFLNKGHSQKSQKLNSYLSNSSHRSSLKCNFILSFNFIHILLLIAFMCLSNLGS